MILLLACAGSTGARDKTDTAAIAANGDTRDSDPEDSGSVDSGPARQTGEKATSEASLTFEGDTGAAQLGKTTFYVPDADGDGRDELVFAVGTDTWMTWEGAVGVFFGGHMAALSFSEADEIARPEHGKTGLPDWGDFGNDGGVDLIERIDEVPYDWWLVWYPVARDGDVSALDIGHFIVAGDTPVEYVSAWRRGDEPDLLAISALSGSPNCVDFYRAPLPDTLESADCSVALEDWSGCSAGRTVGDIAGTGGSAFALAASRADDGVASYGDFVFLEPMDGALADADLELDIPNAEHTSLLFWRGADLDGDGNTDLVLTYTDYTQPAELDTCLAVLSGPVADHADPEAAPIRLCGVSHEEGAPYADVGDFDGDGQADLTWGIGTSARDDFRGMTLLDYGPIPSGVGALLSGDVLVEGSANEEAATPALGGDYDGDGIDDLVVGAPNTSDDELWARGAAFLFWGGPPR